MSRCLSASIHHGFLSAQTMTMFENEYSEIMSQLKFDETFLIKCSETLQALMRPSVKMIYLYLYPHVFTPS